MDMDYCVRRHMFFTVTYPIVERDLTSDEANEICDELNAEEIANGDAGHTWYQVHKQNDNE